jgi:catechol 2,3-dioxygenase-like lactoylglutathione lyase family enzyme
MRPSVQRERGSFGQSGEVPAFTKVVPILRMFDVQKAKDFYVGYLGCTLDWEHTFDGVAPVYLQVSRDGLVLHLSEHHGDGTPGTAIYAEATGLREYHAELRSKAYGYLNPGLETEEDGDLSITLLDPFGNTLRLVEPPAK